MVEDGTRPDIGELNEAETRARREQLRRHTTGLRARLNLLLASTIQTELDRIAGDDGVEVIASAAAVEPTEVWKILAGDHQLTSGTWKRIERILIMCGPAQKDPARVVTAKELFDRVRDLNREIELLTGRLHDFQRQRRAAEVMALSHDRPRPGRPHPDARPRRPGTPSSSPARCPTCGQDEDAPPPSAIGAPACPDPWCPAEPARSGDEPEPATTPQATPDVHGHNRRPDPLRATSQREFMAMLRAYRIWAGNPSLRQMQDRCAKKLSYTTFRNTLAADTIPAKLTTVETVIKVLGGTAEDLQRWATAWRTFAMEPE
nr:hypothetical protein GCM10010200_018310 [Actinomadura rugatobispora]